MGGRRFRLSVHRKNEERKKAMKKGACCSQVIQEAAVPIPRQVTADVIHSQVTTLMSSSSFTDSHPSWKIATADPALTLCKLEVQQLSSSEALCGRVMMSLSINAELKWTVHYLQHQLTAANCPLLSSLPDTISNVAEIVQIIKTLDAAKYCVGNCDQDFVDYWQYRLSTLHGIASKLFNLIYFWKLSNCMVVNFYMPFIKK